MFCLTMNANHLNFIKDLDYIPAGLGEDTFPGEYYRDNSGLNIAKKNNLSISNLSSFLSFKQSFR